MLESSPNYHQASTSFSPSPEVESKSFFRKHVLEIVLSIVVAVLGVIAVVLGVFGFVSSGNVFFLGSVLAGFISILGVAFFSSVFHSLSLLSKLKRSSSFGFPFYVKSVPESSSQEKISDLHGGAPSESPVQQQPVVGEEIKQKDSDEELSLEEASLSDSTKGNELFERLMILKDNISSFGRPVYSMSFLRQYFNQHFQPAKAIKGDSKVRCFSSKENAYKVYCGEGDVRNIAVKDWELFSNTLLVVSLNPPRQTVPLSLSGDLVAADSSFVQKYHLLDSFPWKHILVFNEIHFELTDSENECCAKLFQCYKNIFKWMQHNNITYCQMSLLGEAPVQATKTLLWECLKEYALLSAIVSWMDEGGDNLNLGLFGGPDDSLIHCL